jgi:probable rRNA maturation factor
VGAAARGASPPGLRRRARSAEPRAALPQRHLSIRVVGKARSRSLNARYRHKDRPTNVLSFAGAGNRARRPKFPGRTGDLRAGRGAREARQQANPEAHWAHMTVHGVLHLLGLTTSARGGRKMAAREIQILDRLGFSDPYR